MSDSVKYLKPFFRFQYLNAGVLTTYMLPDEPVNWDKVTIILKRDVTYFGVNYQYTDGDVQLEFDDQSGISILELVFNQAGNDGYIVLQYGYNSHGTEIIEYEGKLNLNTYLKKEGRIQCTLETTGFHELINSRVDTPINLFDSKNLDGWDKSTYSPIDVTLPAKIIRKQLTVPGITPPSDDTINQSFQFDSPGDHLFKYFRYYLGEDPADPKQLTGYEQSINELYLFSTGGNVQDVGPVLPVLRILDSGSYRIRIDIVPIVSLHTTGSTYPTTTYVNFMLQIRDADGVLKAFPDDIFYEQKDWSGTPGTDGNTVIFGMVGNEHKRWILDKSYNLSAGDKVYIHGAIRSYFSGSPDSATISIKCNDILIPGTSIPSLTVTAATTADTSTTKALTLYNALTSATESVTGEIAPIVSDALNIGGEYAENVITNGFFIRKFVATEGDETGRDLTVTLKTLLNSIRSIFCVGLGYEFDATGKQTARIEKAEYFFNDVEIIRIEDCADYKEEAAKEYIYNEVEVGYTKYPDLGGEYLLDEVNTKLSFSTPIKTNKNKLSIMSEFVASGFAMEETRRVQFEASAETAQDSTPYDDSIFIIATSDGNTLAERYTVQNEHPLIYSPETSLNLRITPKRNLLRWAKWLNGCLLYKGDSEVIKNTSFLMNGVACPDINDGLGVLTENADVPLSNFASRDRLFEPMWVSFTCRLSMDDVRLIKDSYTGRNLAKRNGYVTVKNDEGKYVQVWMYEMTYTPVSETVKIKGLKKGVSAPIETASVFAGGDDPYIYGLSNTGNEVWRCSISGAGGGASCIITDSLQNIVVGIGGSPELTVISNTGSLIGAFSNPDNNSIGYLAMQSDGKILAAYPNYGIERYNTDYSIDSTFVYTGYPGAVSMLVLEDDSFWVGGIWASGLIKCDANGNIINDTEFGKIVVSLATDSEGRIYAGTLNDGIYRFNSDGSLDASWTVTDMDGKQAYSIVINGTTNIWVATLTDAIWVFDFNGNRIDFVYTSPTGGDYAIALARHANGKILVANTISIVRMNPGGDQDTSFYSPLAIELSAIAIL